MRQTGGNIRGGETMGEFATALLQEEGVLVTLPDNSTLYATLIQNERDLTMSRPGESRMPDKRPFVWMFGPEAQGKINVGTKLTIDGSQYLVDPPVHPQYEAGAIVYFAVSTYKV